MANSNKIKYMPIRMWRVAGQSVSIDDKSLGLKEGTLKKQFEKHLVMVALRLCDPKYQPLPDVKRLERVNLRVVK
jgi:hypothetical protein